MKPRRNEVIFDRVTGLIKPRRGISVFNRPDGLDRFGGAYQVTNLPPELQVIQIGQNHAHYEIIPAWPMTWQDYEDALNKIVLIPI